jgi:formyltetrahydrofolate deformylase
MNWRIEYSEVPTRVVVFVSKEDHCLAASLAERRAALRNHDVVSHHKDTRALADFHGVPFHHVPVATADKQEVERKQLDLLEKNYIDLIVLARYMQILSSDFTARYPNRIIKVHHSFLPAFIGPKPYHAGV